MSDFLKYRGKSAVVTGGSSGIGLAAVKMLGELGAEIHAFSRSRPEGAPLASFTPVDLGDAASIAAAVERFGDRRVDALFNFAGLNSTFAQIDIARVNYIGTRVFTEAMMPNMVQGGAIVSASSLAGMEWRNRIEELRVQMQISSFDDNVAWFEQRIKEGQHAYVLAKEALIFWSVYRSAQTIRHGVRINCIVPGPTRTPFLEAELAAHPNAMIDVFLQPSGRHSTAEEQAACAILLNSDAAGRINGQAVAVDGGFEAGVTSG